MKRSFLLMAVLAAAPFAASAADGISYNSVQGGYVAKRYWRTPHGIELRSHNPSYQPIVLTEEMDCRIHGKIIAAIQVF